MAQKLSIETRDLSEFAGAIDTIAAPLGAADKSLVGELTPSGMGESRQLAQIVPGALRTLAQWKLGFHGSVQFNAQLTANAARQLVGVDDHNAAAISAAVRKAHDAVPRPGGPS